jgi:hypothetical protein
VQKAEIWRFTVPGQHRQKSLQDPISTEKAGRWYMLVIQLRREASNRKIVFQAGPGKR